MLRALAALLPLVPPVASAHDAADTLIVQAGTLPLLLTVPHDGQDALGSVPLRRKGTTLRDAGTWPLAERVAALIEQRSGQRPYLVIERVSRRFLDVNRSEGEAVESPEALPAYRAYHGQVAAYVAEIKSKFPSAALLLDVHGQSEAPQTTIRGTRGGLTTRRLLHRFGHAALQGPKSLIGTLAARGYAVDPVVDAMSLDEDQRYAGGYTVFTYGSHRAEGIDAIQLEFGRQHRANPRLPEDLAEALMVYMAEYGLLAR